MVSKEARREPRPWEIGRTLTGLWKEAQTGKSYYYLCNLPYLGTYVFMSP